MTNSKAHAIIGWIFGALFVIIGVLNLILIHPVPAIAYFIVSLIYFPPTSSFFERALGFRIHPAIKIILGIIVMWFTLGISDLGDTYLK